MDADKVFPNNWKEVIQGKKVVFYNTGASGLLQKREKRIEKMKRVFQIFKKYPEVVLWWRPHPLELSTLKSMVPELEKQYMAIRQQYMEENIGILDQSTDLNRAIAVSDAYYGDWSSVAHLYEYTGKPILLAFDVIEEVDYRNRLMVSDFEIEGDIMWALSATYNYLFKVRTGNMEVEKAFPFPIGYPYRQEATNLFHIGDRLSILSSQESCKTAFDMGEEKFDLSDVDSANIDGYSSYCAKTDDYIYAVSKTKSRLMKIRKSDMKKQEIIINGINTGFEGIAKVDDIFVLIQAETGFIFLWDEENGKAEKLGEPPCGFKTSDRNWLIGGMIVVDHNVIVVPRFGNMIIEIDVRTKEIQQIGEQFKEESFMNGPLFMCAKKIGSKLYAYASYLDEWIIYDLNTKETLRRKIIMSTEIEEQINNNNIFENRNSEISNKSFKEWENIFPFSFSNYIECLRDKKEEWENYLSVNDCGKKIYESV